MAVTKNALIRYKILNECFRNPGKKYFLKDLIETVSEKLCETDPTSGGIGRRQIIYDIEFMESEAGWSIPLERHKDGRRVWFRYCDIDYSIDSQPLNSIQKEQLNAVIDILSQFDGMEQLQIIKEFLPKLSEGLSSVDGKNPIIYTDTNKYLKGNHHIEMLRSHIVNQQAIEMDYQSYTSDQPKTQIFHPHILKEYNNRWFVIGYVDESKHLVTNFALDRIVSFKPSRKKYKPNRKINWEDYFDDFIGVSRTDEDVVQKIVLHFKAPRAKYVESKPLHPRQKMRWISPDTLKVELNLIINKELESVLLSYGDKVEVIEPKTLRNAIREHCKNILAQ
jgi:predicted DNA-binding transcriptional regulator YafY